MSILELKARFAELHIEELKLNDLLRKILAEKQSVYDKLAQAELKEKESTPDVIA